MSFIQNLNIPEYAKDQKLNLSNVLASENLSSEQIWGTAISSAVASGNKTLIKSVIHEASEHIDEKHITAAKSAAVVMGMNNVYYRFTHFASNPEYKNKSARLRMTVIKNHGIDHADFELYSLAVSAINGCEVCVDGHEKLAIKSGVTDVIIQDIVRIASVIKALSDTLNLEEALAE